MLAQAYWIEKFGTEPVSDKNAGTPADMVIAMKLSQPQCLSSLTSTPTRMCLRSLLFVSASLCVALGVGGGA